MGYYTYYSLQFKGDPEEIEALQQELIKISKYSDGGLDTDIQELLENGTVYAKLYNIEDWFTTLAPKYPNVLIILNGDGEESDDLWEERWKGTYAEIQKAKIPPFTNPNLFTEDEKNNKHNN